MAEPVVTSLPLATNGTPPVAPVAVGNVPAKAPADAPHAPVAARAKQFGGNPTGRARADGLEPGSELALAADREKERLKKERYRARLRAQNPPVLPSRGVSPGAPAPGAPLGTEQAPPDSQNNGVGAPVVEVLAWVPGDFAEIVAELLPAIEQTRVKKRTEKAVKAQLPPELLKEIEKESRWDESTKKALGICVPALGAKYMNLTGISAEWKMETIFAVCIARQWRKDAQIDDKLDKLIALRQQQAAPQNKP